MAVLVTGGAGFIGSHVAEALVARGDDVVVLDDLSTGKRENVPEGAELVEGDIRESQEELFGRVKPTVCFHLAAQADVRVSVERPEHDARINILGTVNLLQAALEHDTRVVFSSTGGAIYGECERPATEDAPRRPLAPYGTSKLAGEEYLATFNRLHGTRPRHARATATSTGRGRTRTARRGVVAIFSRRLLSGEQARIFGDGSQTRDYVYVADVVRATLVAAEQDGGVFNVGTGRETSVVELYELCRRVAGRRTSRRCSRRRVRGSSSAACSTSAARCDELGWRPEHSLEDGLRETWEWMSR